MNKNFMIIGILSMFIIGCTDLPEFSCPDGTAIKGIEILENGNRKIICATTSTTLNFAGGTLIEDLSGNNNTMPTHGTFYEIMRHVE